MTNAKIVARIVYWANHHEHKDAWVQMAHEAGLDLVSPDASCTTYDVDRDGNHIAILRRDRRGEWFAFTFTPEGRAPRLSELWWRLTHPLAKRKDLPWPRRKVASAAHGVAIAPLGPRAERTSDDPS